MMKLLAWLFAGVFALGFVAFKAGDVPKDVSCAGNVPVSSTLRGIRVASALGGMLHTFSRPVPEDDVRRTVQGTWKVLGTWASAFTAALRGQDAPDEVTAVETAYSKAQAARTDGCSPCPTVAGESGIPAGPVVAPVDAPVGAKFGARGLWARYHTGVDYRAGAGTPVRSVSAGRVVAAGPAGDWSGNRVAVQHAGGWTSMYSHLSKVSVSAGQSVTAGTVVGNVGSTGRAFGPHLHFEVYPAGVKPGDVYKAVDPLAWMAAQKTTTTTQVSVKKAAGFTAEQMTIAATANRVATQRGLPRSAVRTIIAAGLVESGLKNLSYGDRDSVGWLQQRPSAGWGTVAQIRQPAYAAGKFFDAMVKVAGWQSMPPGVLAQKVQVSAFPDRYAARLPETDRLLQNLSPDTSPLPPAACTQEPGASPANFSVGGVRTVTEPSTGVQYKIAIPSGPAGAAVSFALDQVGEPYVFGAAGPNSWDCSGLTAGAWGKAGVSMPHDADRQLHMFPSVVGKPPQPGDLWGHPGHVQMFLMTLPSGKALMVEAPRPGKNVQVVGEWMNPVPWKVRPSAGQSI